MDATLALAPKEAASEAESEAASEAEALDAAVAAKVIVTAAGAKSVAVAVAVAAGLKAGLIVAGIASRARSEPSNVAAASMAAGNAVALVSHRYVYRGHDEVHHPARGRHSCGGVAVGWRYHGPMEHGPR